MSEPEATIVIPCYNHGAFVGEAVASALAQEGARTSVVVVDDGSDDGSTPEACDACRGERVEVIHQANLGLPAARNRGAAQAKTEFLVFLDADKESYIAYLAEARRLLRPGGLLVADNAFWKGRVLEEAAADDATTRGVQAFNRALAGDAAFNSTIVPVGDGVAVAVRR